MIVCLDTNVVVQARSEDHPGYSILNAWVEGRLSLAVSTPVLFEYEEVLVELSGMRAWQQFARLLELVELTTGGVLRVTPYYQFRVIYADPDDNLFTDCAITAGADYVVTEDHHFAPLANAGYKPQPITPSEFVRRHSDLCKRT